MTYSECKAIYRKWDYMARLGPIEPYLIRESIRLQAEAADLRRQLAECQAKCERMESFCAVHGVEVKP